MKIADIEIGLGRQPEITTANQHKLTRSDFCPTESLKLHQVGAFKVRLPNTPKLLCL